MVLDRHHIVEIDHEPEPRQPKTTVVADICAQGGRVVWQDKLVNLLAAARIGEVIVKLGGDDARLDADDADSVLLADFNAQAVGRKP
jgi:hypothetical protein